MTAIIYKIGNCLEAPERYILHGTNNQSVMGAGIALAIKKKYPLAYNRYMEAGPQRLGDAQFVNCGEHVIINGCTQGLGKPGRNVDYNAVRKVIQRVNEHFIARIAARVGRSKELTSVAMPRIGCGLGGGFWRTIADIIEEESTDFQPVVYTFASENDGRFD